MATSRRYKEGVDYEIIGKTEDPNYVKVRLPNNATAVAKVNAEGRVSAHSIATLLKHHAPDLPAKPIRETKPLTVKTVDSDELNVLEKTTIIQDALKKEGRVDLFDSADVERRLQRYISMSIEYGLKPTVAGFALALGLHRQRLSEIIHGITGHQGVNCSEQTREVVQYYYNLLEVYFESTFVEGKIQPVVGIFMAKNHYGYKDQTENVIVPATPLNDLRDPQTVAKKYLLDVGDYDEKND